MRQCQYCNKVFVGRKEFEKHVSDRHISLYSSPKSNASTNKKGEEYETEQTESALLKRMTNEEKARRRTPGPYRKLSSILIDDVRN
jgi:uncharacterized C2H2 Zn-finger protein